jgi:hypothetical protein
MSDEPAKAEIRNSKLETGKSKLENRKSQRVVIFGFRFSFLQVPITCHSSLYFSLPFNVDASTLA